MIDITIVEPCRQLMDDVGITEEQVRTTVNHRDRGMVDDGFTRISAAHWFSDQEIVVVESTVTKKEVEKDLGQVRFREVAVQLAIKVQPVLPAGALRRDMEMQQVLRLIAESFGIPVSCHPEQPAVALYTGAWDGRGCRIEPESVSPDQPVLILGTFWPDGRGCENVWVFHQAKYLEWYRAQVWGGHATP